LKLFENLYIILLFLKIILHFYFEDRFFFSKIDNSLRLYEASYIMLENLKMFYIFYLFF